MRFEQRNNEALMEDVLKLIIQANKTLMAMQVQTYSALPSVTSPAYCMMLHILTSSICFRGRPGFRNAMDTKPEEWWALSTKHRSSFCHPNSPDQ